MISFVLEKDDIEYLKNESGGHRWQRIPPTEHKGRYHTSTVTVTVVEHTNNNVAIKDSDIIAFTKRGSGKGGQHRNKTESCVVLRHTPTGIEVKIDGRNQHHNKKVAREILDKRVKDYYNNISTNNMSDLKKTLAGTGQRGDKIRTYREQDDIVTDHRTDKKVRLKDVLKGNINQFYQKE